MRNDIYELSIIVHYGSQAREIAGKIEKEHGVDVAVRKL